MRHSDIKLVFFGEFLIIIILNVCNHLIELEIVEALPILKIIVNKGQLNNTRDYVMFAVLIAYELQFKDVISIW